MSKEDSDKKSHHKMVIEGMTEEGKAFHPRDWAERMSGSLSTFRNRRVIYSPLLRPAVKHGNKCVVLDEALKETHPELYEQILSFAKKNRLIINKEQSSDKPGGDDQGTV